MKLLRSTLLAGVLTASLAGCTYSEPAPEQESEPSQLSPASTDPAAAVPVTLQGQFQSQGASTTGTATIRVTESGASVQLEDFSTGPGDDVRLVLSPGTAGPGPKGDLELSSSTLIEVGPLPLSRSNSQRIDMDRRMWEAIPGPVRSVVIYNFAELTAYGTANLRETPRSQGARTAVGDHEGLKRPTG
ncbi:exported hypothetical protein [Arthrobacter sp. 9AX]|nr:exported hypothetical protein [Arthrobacter sp. 9AX]